MSRHPRGCVPPKTRFRAGTGFRGDPGGGGGVGAGAGGAPRPTKKWIFRCNFDTGLSGV